MDPVAQPIQPIGIEEGRPQATFLRGLLRTLQGFWSKELHRLNRVLPKDGTEAMTGPLELFTYTVATLPTASDFTGSVIYVSDGGPRHSRVLVKKTSDQTINDLTNTSLIWQTIEYDPENWFASVGDAFLTVPTGVTKVRLSANVTWEPGAGTFRLVNFLQDGAAFVGATTNADQPTGATLLDARAIISPDVECSAGDEFSVNVFQITGGTLDVIVTNNTFFGIEATEFAEGYGGTFQGSNGTRWVPLG